MTSPLALLTLSSTTPLSPRDAGPDTIVDSSSGATLTTFAPNHPTCGTDHLLTDTFVSTTLTVDVRQDCDPVIDTICAAAAKQALLPATTRPQSLQATSNTCQGFILFPATSNAARPDYATCVAGFQAITETCMLLNPGWKNQAADKQQAGVQNVVHYPPAVTQSVGAVWTQAVKWGFEPGYMMGPKGYFGAVDVAKEASLVQADGTIAA